MRQVNIPLALTDFTEEGGAQGVTKRFRLSGLTNSALVYEPKCEGEGGGGVARSQTMSSAVHMEPK